MARGSFSSSSWGPQRHTNVRTSCFVDTLSAHAAIAARIAFVAFLVRLHFCDRPARTSRLASCGKLYEHTAPDGGQMGTYHSFLQ